jgi:P27 family predicted phage terminase small subunit
LAAYACAYARWRTGEELLARGEGLIVDTAEGGPRQNPLVTVARTAAAAMLAFASQLGATPIARARIGTGIGGHETGDGKFAGLLCR